MVVRVGQMMVRMQRVAPFVPRAAPRAGRCSGSGDGGEWTGRRTGLRPRRRPSMPIDLRRQLDEGGGDRERVEPEQAQGGRGSRGDSPVGGDQRGIVGSQSAALGHGALGHRQVGAHRAHSASRWRAGRRRGSVVRSAAGPVPGAATWPAGRARQCGRCTSSSSRDPCGATWPASSPAPAGAGAGGGVGTEPTRGRQPPRRKATKRSRSVTTPEVDGLLRCRRSGRARRWAAGRRPAAAPWPRQPVHGHVASSQNRK